MGPDDREKAGEAGAPDPRLLEWAEAIADRRPVDWAHARERGTDLTGSIVALELVESVIQAHHSARQLAATSPPLPPGTTWGGLRLMEKIGEGVFGEVYRAFDPALEIEVALKLLRLERTPSESATQQFFDEARRLARVRHDHVLRVYGTDRREGRVGIWTELIRGRDLERILVQDGHFGAREAALIGIDLCGALAAVHAAGLVHRDLKTQNVMREQGGRIVLMDFGSVSDLARLSGGDHRAYGTPLTVAPELLRGKPATPATDIYALGVLLYRIVSGRYPIEASSFGELLEKHDRGEWTSLRELRPDLPLGFVQTVERALNPTPEGRFAGPGAMERALAAVGRGTSRGGSKRNRVRWALVAAASGALLFTMVAMLTGVIPGVSRPPNRVTPAAVSMPAPSSAASSASGHETGTVGRPAPLAPLNAAVALYRQEGDLSETLQSGAHVARGDALFMDLDPAERMYVYVTDEDEFGNFYLIFPLPDHDLQNPLAPNVRYRLPGSRLGTPQDWKITSSGGEEQIVAIGSRVPLDSVIREFVRAPVKLEGVVARGNVSGAPSGPVTRGIGGTTPAPDRGGHPRTAALLRLLSEHGGHDDWVWKTELVNPALTR